MSSGGADPDLANWGEASLAALFGGLGTAPALLLAVSGGPDSLALLHLATRWSVSCGGPRLHVATVNHGLRAEAAAEAALVADASAALGHAHATLPWRGPKPTTRIQERARAMRYALLTEHARSLGATHILTAHHADDQAETVLMRLGRGSGVAGLAGMRRCTSLGSDLALVRPLLDLPKAALVALCRAKCQPWADDPSNADPAYARGRLRRLSAEAASLGLERPALLRLARRMARADAALERETTRVERLIAPDRRPEFWRAGLDPAGALTPEILGRILRRAIVATNGGAEPRLERLETLTDALYAAFHARRPYRGTLGGVEIGLSAEAVLTLQREAGRRRSRSAEPTLNRAPEPAEMTR